MERACALRLTERLRAELAGRAGGPDMAAAAAKDNAAPPPVFAVPAARYRDAAWCERERAALFGGPRVVTAASALAVNACLPVDRPAGAAAIVARGPDGVVRAFANACRHRATRLVDAPCSAKAIVCPYHAWTYDLTGALIHVPHPEAFPGLDPAHRGLVPLPAAERHGLVWLGADIDAYLGDVGADLAALGLDRHVLWQRAHAERRCNWKLVVEAFLDGYHIRTLHRDTVYRFFLDAASVSEAAGPHVRAVTGRRVLREAPTDLSGVDLRQLATPTLLLFPSTVVVEHPDFVSIMTMTPLAPDRTAWDHMMLVPAERAGEAAHWDRSWALIEEGVFQREDLWVCEQNQRGIETGGADELVFGALEREVRHFHGEIEREIERRG